MTTPHTIRRPQGGGPQPVLAAEDLEGMKDMAARGCSLREIGEAYFVHYTTAGRYLRAAGIIVNTPHRTTRTTDPDDVLRTCELAAQGYSTRDIAQLMGVHPTSVRERLRKHARDTSWKRRAHRLPDDGRYPPRA